MTTWQLQTPVVFLIFSRPDTTARVFAEIARARPPKLFVVADGPRPDRPGEADKCAATRAIIDQVDWPCEVHTNYADTNMGLRKRVSSGLTWAFSREEQAIILEDDCVPHPSFFRYCDELLAKYQDDERVMAIGGINLQRGRRRTSDSYYYSYYNHCWGWASWRRAWQHYDGDMIHWPQVREGGWLQDVLGDAAAVAYWQRHFDAVYEGRTKSWAFCWLLSCWIQHGLTILPNMNLVSNVGFNQESTHTSAANDPLANIPVREMAFPMQHPSFVVRNKQADDFTERLYYSGKHHQSAPTKVRRRFHHLVSRVLYKARSILRPAK